MPVDYNHERSPHMVRSHCSAGHLHRRYRVSSRSSSSRQDEDVVAAANVPDYPSNLQNIWK